MNVKYIHSKKDMPKDQTAAMNAKKPHRLDFSVTPEVAKMISQSEKATDGYEFDFHMNKNFHNFTNTSC